MTGEEATAKAGGILKTNSGKNRQKKKAIHTNEKNPLPQSKEKRHQVFAWWAGSSEIAKRRLQWPLSREALDICHCLPARWAGGSVRYGNALKRQFKKLAPQVT